MQTFKIIPEKMPELISRLSDSNVPFRIFHRGNDPYVEVAETPATTLILESSYHLPILMEKRWLQTI